MNTATASEKVLALTATGPVRAGKKTAPELLDPECRHLACAARLAVLIAEAWREYSGKAIDPGTVLIVVPEGGQRSHDVYRATVYFKSEGMTQAIDSWSTCTQMLRQGRVFLDADHTNNLEMSHMEWRVDRTNAIS